MITILKFILNGQKYSLDSKINILDLMKYLKYSNIFIIVEYNNKIFSRKNFINISIKENDNIEFVTIVGGG